MARKRNSLDDLDGLLIAAQRARKDPTTSLSAGIAISRKILEFVQNYKVLKYREMRALTTAHKNLKELQYEIMTKSEQHLAFKPDNWALFSTYGDYDNDEPKIIPETYNAELGLVSHKQDMKQILIENEEIRRLHGTFEKALEDITKKFRIATEWIHEQFINGTLESKIISFKDNKNKKRTKISKSIISNLINPQATEIVREEGEIPLLGVGEREALQYLFCKLENMNERELHIKNNWILSGRKEDTVKDGYLVVFDKNEALRRTYGENIVFSGKHYNNLKSNLEKLWETKRKLLLKRNGEQLELSLTLIKRVEMRHKVDEHSEYRNYIAVWIPHDVVYLHDDLYTSFPHDHFPKLRHTPPKTTISESEIRFFDFLYQEMPHDKDKGKDVRRKKAEFIELIGGQEVKENRHLVRIIERIEKLYAPKAINMGLLRGFTTEINKKGEEVYVFKYADKKNLEALYYTPEITSKKSDL